MSEKLGKLAKEIAEQFVVEQSAGNWYAVAHKVSLLGVEQYIRDNGWGNVEWQTRSLLKGMEKRGVIRSLNENRSKFEVVGAA